MSYQTGRNINVAYKPEVTFGVAEDATGAKIFRPNNGSLNLTKEAIKSNENRSDGQMTRGRHGSRACAAQYSGDLSLGSYDDFIEAVMRGTFTSILTVTQAAMSSATLSASGSAITASAGSWITAGFRVGDVVRFSAGLTGNLDRNLRITALTATVMTVAETLVTVAGPVASWSVSRGKKVVMGTTRRSFTLEENEIDIDASKLGKGLRVSQLKLSLQPNGMAIVTFDMVGQDMEALTGSEAPYFTAPTKTTSIGMTAVEAVIRLGTVDVLDVSAVDLTINLNAAGFPVVGSVFTPDVFDNLANVEGSITALKKDIARTQGFLDETEYSLHLLFTENESEPKDYISFFVGNLTLGSATDSDLGADGPRTQAISMMIGKDERGGAYEASTVVYQTSAA